MWACTVGPAVAETFRDCPTCPEMVTVPPGEFVMGEVVDTEPERFEGPKREVRINYSFAVGRYEVTNGEYRQFVAATGHKSAGTGCNVFLVDTVKARPGTSWADPDYGRPIKDNEPVACIRWSDAKSYVSWLAGHTGKKYRLLTEAEWEYAARAGTHGRYVWDASNPGEPCRYANTHDESGAKAAPTLPSEAARCDDGYAGVAPVGSFAPNTFGLYDMIGNVWEWIEDCYEMPYGATPVDGSAQLAIGCDRRGSRGGSWRSDIKRQRPAFRDRDPEALTSQIFGMRVAREL